MSDFIFGALPASLFLAPVLAGFVLVFDKTRAAKLFSRAVLASYVIAPLCHWGAVAYLVSQDCNADLKDALVTCAEWSLSGRMSAGAVALAKGWLLIGPPVACLISCASLIRRFVLLERHGEHLG